MTWYWEILVSFLSGMMIGVILFGYPFEGLIYYFIGD